MKPAIISSETNSITQVQNTALSMISRRNWLRSVGFAAASAAVLPSMLTSCVDHDLPPGGGLGDLNAPLYEIASAAQNIQNMRKWYEELDKRNNKYVFHAYTLIKSGGDAPTNWEDVLIDIFVRIGAAILEAVVEELPVIGQAAGAAIAIAGEEILKWGIEKKEGGSVDKAFGEYTEILIEIYDRVDNKLRALADPTDNYAALRAELDKNGGSFKFNNREYTLTDLAAAKNKFPEPDSAAFGDLLTPAERKFKMLFWNAIFVKAGNMEEYYLGPYSYHYPSDVRDFMQQYIYTDNPAYEYYTGSYARAYYDNFENFYRIWVFEFDDKLLSADAAKELFIDTTPAQRWYPDKDGNPTTGLFARDYVFKQFHTEKPYFKDGYHDVAKPGVHAYNGIEYNDDYVFTGGL